MIALVMLVAGGVAATSMPAPEIFAPGVISGPSNDGAPTFTPDYKTLYFDRSNAKWSVILASHLEAHAWSAPEIAEFSGAAPAEQPALSPDGTRLVYVLRVDLPAAQAGAPLRHASHIVETDRTASGWSAPKELPAAVNISNAVFKPSMAANRDLYFMSAKPGTQPGKNWCLHRSSFLRGAYQNAEPLSFSCGTASDVDPAIAPDGSYIVFSSQGREPMNDGHEHLFIAFRRGGDWSTPAPMRYAGDISGSDDGEANISPDGKTLYFTSSRPAPAISPGADVGSYYARMQAWDNGNNNVWMLPLAPYLKG